MPTKWEICFFCQNTKRIDVTLTSNDAFYTKICYDNFNDCRYERLLKKVQQQSSEGSIYSTQTIPHERKNTKQVAMQLVELDVHVKLCCRDVRASEIYHKATCYTQFRKRYRSLQRQQEQKEWINGKRNNSSGVLCMEADIQPIWYTTSQSFLLTSVTSI